MASESSGKPKIPLIGILAVKNHLITKADLHTGISKCAGASNLSRALEDYLISNQLVSEENIKRLSRAAKAYELRQREFKFGAIAVRKGFINQSVLTLVLEEQQADIKAKRQVRLIGDMLLEAGMITPKQKAYVLKLQNRLKQEGEKQHLKPEKQAETDTGKTGEAEAEQTDAAVKKTEKKSGLLEPETIVGGIALEVSRDYMAAFLSKTAQFDENISVEEIKEALLDKGIILGIVSDEMIQGFINSSGFKTKSFRVAKGIVPIEGKDARVEFFFNIDYLKAGGMTQDGTIDFRERGEVPHVEEGTVLAEKTPAVESRDGRNIYGDEIPTVTGQDVPFKYGKGAKMSEDGYKILAAVTGFPKYALSGYIFVHDVYVSEGDVDYETGHVQYDGHVDIKGRIKAGFKVTGNDVKAVELDGGIINAEGDVHIIGGINEGRIYSRGNVFAKFIHNSEVVCMGDVVIQKEIVDAEIESSGSCVVENGKLISSKVTAKMGVTARNIGTQMTSPCQVNVGLDSFTEKELEKNKTEISSIKKRMDRLLEKEDKLKQEHLNLQKQITELAHLQDRSQLEEKQLESEMAELESQGDGSEKLDAIRQKLARLKENAARAEKSLDACFDKSEKIEEMLDTKGEKLRMLEKSANDFKEERNNLIQWSKDNPGNALVVVEGALMPGTIIRGRHSEIKISEMVRHVRVLETRCASDEAGTHSLYEMQIGNI